MCGGRGTRLGTHLEKPLVRVGGEPMVDRVVGAFEGTRVERVYAVVSPATPATANHLGVPVIETPGEGYVADLRAALADDRVDPPVLTVAADLPLLDATVVDDVVEAHCGGSTTVVVPVERKRALGVSVDERFDHEGTSVAPAGLNVVGGGPDRVYPVDDDRLAVNVNRPADLAVARRLA